MRDGDGMLARSYVEDYLPGLAVLRGVYPEDSDAIAAHAVVVALDDDDVFVFLLRLVGPAAPVFADELWLLISIFLNSRRAEELFGGSAGTGWEHLNAVKLPRYIPPAASGDPGLKYRLRQHDMLDESAALPCVDCADILRVAGDVCGVSC